MATTGTITLDTLLRDYLLGLVLLAGIEPDIGDRPVQWVHSSDLADPTPFLTPRTVLLTTGTQFLDETDDEWAETYVHQLVLAGCTALGIAVGIRWERIPPALIEACDRLHLPLIRVPYDTPFLAVVRTAARLIEAKNHASATWDREHSSLTLLAKRHRDVAASERAIRKSTLSLLLAGSHDLAVEVAAPVLPLLPRGQIYVCAWQEAPSQMMTELGSLLTNQDGIFAAKPNANTIVVIEAASFAAIKRVMMRHAVVAGISERGGLQEITELVEQAERALELAYRHPEDGPVEYQPSMHSGLMQMMSGSAEALRRAKGLLAPLRKHDERHQDNLLTSLTAWLRHHGQTSAAATELQMHRHTLRNKVVTSADLLQRDLDDPDVRAEVWAALRLTE